MAAEHDAAFEFDAPKWVDLRAEVGLYDDVDADWFERNHCRHEASTPPPLRSLLTPESRKSLSRVTKDLDVTSPWRAERVHDGNDASDVPVLPSSPLKKPAQRVTRGTTSNSDNKPTSRTPKHSKPSLFEVSSPRGGSTTLFQGRSPASSRSRALTSATKPGTTTTTTTTGLTTDAP
eukprot:Rmarinus@m.6254